MPTIVHFEIPAHDIERAKGFYNRLFGWKAEKILGRPLEEGPMEYWIFRTGKEGSGEHVMSGAIMKRMQPDHSITNYVNVDSVAEYEKKIEKLGGKVKVPKTEVPGMGWFAICTDTENNTFALWEQKMPPASES
ncbi:VOC family protein [Nitrososphaera viennensis]|uniref:VOC family protein n=2 Tax=Nitrososphaera viennensis TaxID=1034015 RepID=A0A977NNL6_9ARCH|nr:VOC family protein [Nitrososphaera viennensis]UVS70562.1 VOC family protein [Nitrososphaera viennensis]